MRMMRIRKPGRPSGMSIRKCRRVRNEKRIKQRRPIPKRSRLKVNESITSIPTPLSQSSSPFDCQALHEMLLEAHEAELSGKISGKELPLKCNSRSQVLMYMCFYCALFSFKSDLSLLAFVALIFQFRKNLQVHQLQEDSGSPASPTSLPGVEAPCFKGKKHEQTHESSMTPWYVHNFRQVAIKHSLSFSNYSDAFCSDWIGFQSRQMWVDSQIHMNKTKSKTASAASLNVPDHAEMRVTWQNRRWEKDFSTTVFQVLCFHPSWVVESISWQDLGRVRNSALPFKGDVWFHSYVIREWDSSCLRFGFDT